MFGKHKEVDNHEFTARSLDTGAYAHGISNRWQWLGAITGAIIPSTIIWFTPSKSLAGKSVKPAIMALTSVVGWVGGWGVGLIGGEISGHRKANRIQGEIVQMLGENEGLKRENAVLKEELGLQNEDKQKHFTERFVSRGSNTEARALEKESASQMQHGVA